MIGTNREHKTEVEIPEDVVIQEQVTIRAISVVKPIDVDNVLHGARTVLTVARLIIIPLCVGEER